MVLNRRECCVPVAPKTKKNRFKFGSKQKENQFASFGQVEALGQSNLLNQHEYGYNNVINGNGANNTTSTNGTASSTKAGSQTKTETKDNLKVVLVGNPNAGKSTLFNALTGANQKIMNSPRTTVAMAVGQWRLEKDLTVSLTDLPGTYSLDAQSPDEEVTAQAVRQDTPDLAIVTVDANALATSLFLLGQVALTDLPVVVAVTMLDIAQSQGVEIDLTTLSNRLGVPVVPINPRREQGLAALSGAVRQALASPQQITLGLSDLVGV